MSWMASIFESRAAAERSLTTKLLMPPGVRDGATSPDAGRRLLGVVQQFVYLQPA
jgi:hypothetical protein